LIPDRGAPYSLNRYFYPVGTASSPVVKRRDSEVDLSLPIVRWDVEYVKFTSTMYYALWVYLTTLFIDSDYVASNEGVISKSRVGKDVGESGRGLILRHYPSICLEGLRKTKENFRLVGLWTEI
jgi:hypothetical protein